MNPESLAMLISSLSDLRELLGEDMSKNDALIEQVGKTLMRSLKQMDQFYGVAQN